MTKKRAKRASTRKPRRPATRRPARKTRRAEEAAFVKSLVSHGQAVALPPGGTLPPGATHELVTDERGGMKVVRKRFSAI